MRQQEKKYAKILRKHPQIKQCFIRLIRDPAIESMVKNIEPLKRMSTRLMERAMKTTVTNKPISLPQINCTPKKARRPQKGSIQTARSAHIPKSILKGANCLRNRSKSVSFDFNVGSPKKRPNIDPVRRNLFTPSSTPSVSAGVIAGSSGCSTRSLSVGNNWPIDLTTSGKPASPAHNGGNQNEVADHTNETAGVSGSNTSNALSSGQVLGYENRIESLIQSNKSKITRIKELLAERQLLLAQVEDLHRINRSLTSTVDMYLEQDENDGPNGNKSEEQINQLKDQLVVLRGRLDRSNNQNFILKAENEKLKAALGTHSKKVQSEHNYNL